MPTRVRAVRVDDETWGRWTTQAADAGVSVSAYIRAQVDRSAMIPLVGAAVLSRPREPKPAAPPPNPSNVTGRTRRERTGLCEHRRPPGTFCIKCDQ